MTKRAPRKSVLVASALLALTATAFTGSAWADWRDQVAPSDIDRLAHLNDARDDAILPVQPAPQRHPAIGKEIAPGETYHPCLRIALGDQCGCDLGRVETARREQRKGIARIAVKRDPAFEGDHNWKFC